ncbi:MAG: type II toxin-antitoxin system death-on-curing family toxin [Chloroflexia bacterium]
MPDQPFRQPSVLDVIAMHQEIMVQYGQSALLRDNGEALLDSAMMRPQMAAHYEEADLSKQAALLILGIAQAHPFVDGNKRAAFAAGIVFLQLNGYLVKSRPREFGERIVRYLSNRDRSSNSEDQFADWIRGNLWYLSEENS